MLEQGCSSVALRVETSGGFPTQTLAAQRSSRFLISGHGIKARPHLLWANSRHQQPPAISSISFLGRRGLVGHTRQPRNPRTK